MDLSTTYAGIHISHPLIAASSGATRDVFHVAKCEEAGYAAVILKSVQEEVLMRHNPFPRFKVLELGIPGYSATTFYCYEQAYEGDIEDYAETLYQSKRLVSFPVIASINCIMPDRWGDYAVACEQAGADAIEIVPSCPTGLLIREVNDNHAISLAALRLCKSKVKIPVIPKMTSQVANMIYTAKCLDDLGADGLTIFNRPTGLEIDIDTMAPILHGGFAGHGGPWALNAVLRWIIEIAPLVRCDISATNGVSCWQDAVKCILAGASSVQVCTLMYLKGFEYVQEMIAHIKTYLEEKQVGKLLDLRGVAAKHLLRMDQFDRIHRYVAGVVPGKCTKCRKCAKVCIYEAINYTESGPIIISDKCDGCGLCVSICSRQHAIEINRR